VEDSRISYEVQRWALVEKLRAKRALLERKHRKVIAKIDAELAGLINGGSGGAVKRRGRKPKPETSSATV
jgi:hypothetical protein